MKATAERWMVYDAATQKVKYAKKEGDLKSSSKGVKEIDCSGAEITTQDKGKVYWLVIKKKGKVDREIGSKSKDVRDKWKDAIKGAGGEKKGDDKPKENKKAEPEKKKEEPKKEEPKKTEAKKDDAKKDEPKKEADTKKAAPASAKGKKADTSDDDDDDTSESDQKKERRR